MATSVTRHAITWTFGADYTVGTFTNGDPWVKEPTNGSGISITDIDPNPITSNGGAQHGTMVNPYADYYPSQGFDYRGTGYLSTLNLTHNGTGDFPLAISANTSVVSSVSLNPATADQERPVISDASVLTVLPYNITPATGDFRPGYVGTGSQGGTKTIKWNVSDIDWSRLPSLTPPNGGANVPTLATAEGDLDRLFLTHATTGNGRDIHPSNQMMEYGRDVAEQTGTALLRLMLNDSQAAKTQAVTDAIQIGIDIYESIDDGNISYSANGGQNVGYKGPMMFAGYMLNDSNILAHANTANTNKFQEDQQTFYVTQADVDDCPKYSADGRGRDCYTVDMIGNAEWGEKGSHPDDRDASNWDAYYRDQNIYAMTPHWLVAEIMGTKTAWNHDALFDYYNDRVVVIDALNTKDNFNADMFIAYVEPSSVPSVPTGLTSVLESPTRVKLEWTDTSSVETEFSIARSTSSGSGFTEIGTSLPNVAKYYDSDISEETTYYYKVLARNLTGDSAYTAESSVTTGLFRPQLPQSLRTGYHFDLNSIGTKGSLSL